MLMLDNLFRPDSTLFAGILAALATHFVFRSGRQADVARERLNTVYFKAFQFVEPYLYQPLPRAECDRYVSELEKFAREGGVLTDPEFLALIAFYWKAPPGDLAQYPNYKYSFFKNEDCYLTCWFELCRHIDGTYDSLCRRSFLPLRNIAYRLNRNQYINTRVWVFNLLRFSWPAILFFLFAFAVALLMLHFR